MGVAGGKKVSVIVAAVVVLILVAFAGSSWAGSYYLRQGEEAYQKGEFDRAEQVLSRALFFNSKKPEVHYYLGRVALGPLDSERVSYPVAKYDEAIRHFEKALSLGLETSNTVFFGRMLHLLGYSYRKIEKYDKSDSAFLKRIQALPDSSFDARLFVADDYLERFNRPEEAFRIVLPATGSAYAESKFYYRALVVAARLYFYFEDYANAEKYARLAIEKGGDIEKDAWLQVAHNLLALLYARKGEVATSEEEIKKSNALAVTPGANNCVLAAAYVLAKKYQQAVVTAEKHQNVKYPYLRSICLNALGDAYAAFGKKETARRSYEEYLVATDTMEYKNIYVIRNRSRITELLHTW